MRSGMRPAANSSLDEVRPRPHGAYRGPLQAHMAAVGSQRSIFFCWEGISLELQIFLIRFSDHHRHHCSTFLYIPASRHQLPLSYSIMGFLSALRPSPVAPVVGTATRHNSAPVPAEYDHEKGSDIPHVAVPHDTDSDSEDELVHKDAQWGVQKAEAMCQAWGKKSLYGSYAM